MDVDIEPELCKILRTHFRRLLRNRWGRHGFGLRRLKGGFEITDRRVEKSGTRTITVVWFGSHFSDSETELHYSDDRKNWIVDDLNDPQSIDKLEHFVFGVAVADPPERITSVDWCRTNLGE